MRLIFWINRNRGYAIYCRITVDGKRAELATGMKCTGRWLNGRTGDALTDTKLAEIEYKLRKIELMLSIKGEAYDAMSIKGEYESEEIRLTTPRLLDIMLTKDKIYNAAKAQLEKFLQKKNPKLDELDQAFADRLGKWLDTKVQTSTRKMYFAKIIASIRQAIKDHPKPTYPNMIEKLPFVTPESGAQQPRMGKSPKYLTLEQYNKLKGLKLDEKLNFYRNCFVTQCESGMAMADFNEFSLNNVHSSIDGSKYIRYSRVKNGQEAIIPLSDELQFYKDICDLRVQHTEMAKLSRLRLKERTYNKHLKQIGKKIGFDNMTSHNGRHTFGVLKLIDGYSMESVSKMMGHSSITTTEKVYAQVTLDKLFKEQKNIIL